MYETTSSSREYSSSWYLCSIYVPFTYVDNVYEKVNYQGISSLKLSYGFIAPTKNNIDCFFDAGFTNYRGSYNIISKYTRTITSGTAPPNSNVDSSTNYDANFNLFTFNISFGVQF